MLKLQWSDYFVPFGGPMGRKDYFVAFFKLGVAYFVSVQVISLLLTLAFDELGGASLGDLSAYRPVAVAVTQLMLLWSVLALVHRRILDVKQSLREKYRVWRLGFPVALVVFVGANLMRAFGLERFVEGQLVSPLGPLMILVIAAAGLMTPEDGTVATQAAKPAAPKRAELELPSATPVAKPAKAYAGETSRPAPKPRPALTRPAVVQRTRPLPEQGRVRSGWFN